MPPVSRSFAAAAARYLQSSGRVRLETGAFDAAARSFGPQRRFLLDAGQFRCVCTTRRAGKSTGYVLDMLAEATRHPRTSVIYLNTTRERARRTIWEELKVVAASAGLGGVPNESQLSMRLPCGSWLHVSGGESKKHVDKWKGVQPSVSAVYVDEAQDWAEDVLEHAIARVILPALADRGGRLTVAGTPGPLPEGTFHALTRNQEWSQHSWSLFENPHLRDPRAELAKVLALRGVDESDATIQREYFGRWVRDTAALVFGAFDDTLNTYETLPAVDGWRHVAGVDFGFVDASAAQVVGWSPRAPGMWGVVDEAWYGIGPSDTVRELERVLARFHGSLVGAVGDPGGGGKGMMHDLWSRYGVQLEPAEKAEKVTACRLLADAIRTRELKLPRASVDLIRDLRRVQWDPDYRGIKLKGHTPDRVDALLYAFRKAWPLYRQEEPPVARSYDDELAERIRQRGAAEDAYERELY